MIPRIRNQQHPVTGDFRISQLSAAQVLLVWFLGIFLRIQDFPPWMPPKKKQKKKQYLCEFVIELMLNA